MMALFLFISHKHFPQNIFNNKVTYLSPTSFGLKDKINKAMIDEQRP